MDPQNIPFQLQDLQPIYKPPTQSKRPTLIIGIIILLFVAGLAFINYRGTKKSKNGRTVIVSPTQTLIPNDYVSNEKIYTDPKGKYKISLPDGWEIFHTQYWIAFRLTNSTEFVGENINFEYDTNFKSRYGVSKINEPLINLISEDNNKLYSDNSVQNAYENLGKLPILSTVTKGKNKGTLEECKNVTVKGGGYLCTSNGNYFLKKLYIEKKNGDDVLELTINSNSEKMREVNLADWVDRVKFIGN